VGVQMRWPLFTGYAVQSDVEQTAHLLEKSQSDLDSARLAAAQKRALPTSACNPGWRR
jgi:hypothetical protein